MKVILTLLACCIFIPSCAAFKKDKPDDKDNKPVAEGPKLIGRIASVPADKRFVLIQSYGPWNIETGRILTTRGLDNRTANLRTTGEKLGEFAAADLQSGLVEVGDAVYFQHIVKPTPPPSPLETLQPLENPDVENVQKNN